MAQQTGTRITSVRTVAIPVADQDEAVAFYVGTLGFEKRLDVVSARGCGGSRSLRAGRPRRSRSSVPGRATTWVSTRASG